MTMQALIKKVKCLFNKKHTPSDLVVYCTLITQWKKYIEAKEELNMIRRKTFRSMAEAQTFFRISDRGKKQ